MSLLAILPAFGLIVWGYDIVHLVIALIIIGGVIAIGYIALNKFGITIPEWVRQVIVVVCVVFVCVIAIKIIAELL